MIRSQFRLLGPCAIILGVLIFATGTAQSEPAANWLILNSLGVAKTGAELHSLLESTLEDFGSLLTRIIGINVKVLCSAVELVGVNLEGTGSLTSGGKAKFSGCRTYLRGEATPTGSCEPKAGGEPFGTILTNMTKGLLVLHEVSEGVNVGVVKIEPVTGSTLVTLSLKEVTCPIGQSVPIIGKLFIKDCEGKLETHLEKHLVEQGPLTELWAISKTPEHVVNLDGSALVFLGVSSPHNGFAWSGMPQ